MNSSASRPVRMPDSSRTPSALGRMSFARTLGEGPHYYEWMREFGDCEADRRIMLILNTDNHPDDDTLWRLMEQRWGE